MSTKEPTALLARPAERLVGQGKQTFKPPVGENQVCVRTIVAYVVDRNLLVEARFGEAAP